MSKGGDGGEKALLAATSCSDGGGMKRESSLLPGEVRTPTMIVSLSEAWGESSADWAAPGSSAVWEEEAPSRHSVQTPLKGYGHSDVWASATGSPLMGADAANQTSFGQAEKKDDTDTPDAAEVAAAALQALSPRGMLHVDAHDAHSAQLQRPSPQPRYSVGAGDAYESRFGTVREAPLAKDLTQLLQHPQQPQPPQNPHYFTVQEGPVATSAAFAEPAPMLRDVVHATSPASDALASSSGGLSYVPRLQDGEVAQRIIISAGLPLSLHSLVDYLHKGQPRAPAHSTALGTTQNAKRNYPNLNEPPTEEETLSGHGAVQGARPQRGGYGQSSQGPCGPARSWTQDDGFAVRGQDSVGGPQQDQVPALPSNYSGSFVVSAAPNGPVAPLRASTRAPYGPQGNGAAARHKSESKYLSDLLHFHANFFPPPPPPRVPKDERRNRAELWYHYASKWDITHRLPPPPRTPLPEMELEYRMRLPQMTRVPYHGDGWLQMSERWFDVTQALFDFPEDNVGDEVDFDVVLQQAVLS
ncbi:hypothetical protein LSCM1_01547 [Leishmania martiniquensis]|uniref:Uncharacterized protein n=1 Tax=Leishmania martiniquensis TaxID=1580590 RepID=A0A836KMQ8_9TRYP|nr:hypothetical protein LSCM1_01547 [Leishmania martiniquensis]